MSKVHAVVAATSVESGRFRPEARIVDLDSMLYLFDQLTGIGQGYLEVVPTESPYPYLTVGFRDGFAVVHCSWSPDEISLLRGDGSIAPGETVEVPIMDELAIFTAEFAVSATLARKVLKDFVSSRTTESLGEWLNL